MNVVICDKCGRRCEKDNYRLNIQHPTKTTKDGGEAHGDMCSVCVFALAEFLPSTMKHLLPSKDRAELVAKSDASKPAPL